MKKAFIHALLLSTVLSTAAPSAMAIEEPRHTLVQKLDGIEIRDYAPYIVAEVQVPGPAEQAGNQGFRYLGGYIFGRNKGERKIAMTAPVTQTAAEPVKIAMTAPVTQAASDNGFRVQFMMPSSFTLDTLPEPLDPQVQLREVPGARYAVIRYSGTWSQANYEEHLQKLRSTLQRHQMTTEGEPIYSRYDAPFMPWFLRRNEIWLKLP